MITLEDCTAFCDASEPDVARVAREQRLTMVVAIACAHSRHAAHAERKPNASPYARNVATTRSGEVKAAGLLPV